MQSGGYRVGRKRGGPEAEFCVCECVCWGRERCPNSKHGLFFHLFLQLLINKYLPFPRHCVTRPINSGHRLLSQACLPLNPGYSQQGSWGRTDVMTTRITANDLFGQLWALEPESQVDDGRGNGGWGDTQGECSSCVKQETEFFPCRVVVKVEIRGLP